MAARPRPRRYWRWALGLLALGFIGVVAAVTLPFWTVPIVRMEIGRHERELIDPAQMQRVGQALALYCNSVDGRLDSGLGVGWLPRELRLLEPSTVSVAHDDAAFYFGGGFHGAGYHLQRTNGARWELSFSSEDGWTDPQTVGFEQDRKLSRDELVRTMKESYRGYLAEPASDERALQARSAWLRFLLSYGTDAELREAARELVVRLPDHVGARYMTAVVAGTLGSRAEAASDFIAWVKSAPGFRHDAILAHYLVSQGQTPEALAAARDALGRPLIDPPRGPDLIWNYSALGSTLIADVLALDPDLALRLCEKIEREEIDTSTRAYYRTTLGQLRRRALARKQGRSVVSTSVVEEAPPLDFDREFFGSATCRVELGLRATATSPGH